MLSYPHLSPVAFSIGSFHVRWYGIMYLLGFLLTYLLIRKLLQTKRFDSIGLGKEHLGDLYFYLILGVIIGGRLGYALLYNLPYYWSNPLSVFALWQGGMSFHGGLVGVLYAVWLFGKKRKIMLLNLCDLLCIVAPIGIALGRVGNFINGELYGRVTNVPWCMTFPAAPLCRHPAQIYGFLLEGIFLFVFMWTIRNRFTNPGQLTGIFLIGYGAIRFFIEFFREPDAQLGFLFAFVTMGQLLSFLLVACGAVLLFSLRKRKSLGS